jgi:long-chain acyl-CoA synthetase
MLFNPLNTHLTAAELSTIMEHSGTKVLVIDKAYEDVAAGLTSAAAELHVLFAGVSSGPDSLAVRRAEHPKSKPDERAPGALFVYTSGTTGKPKGIRRPLPPGDPDRAANDAALFGRAFDFRPFDGPMLVSTGMFHGGSHSFYMGGLNVGHGLVIMGRFDAEESLRLIQQHRVRTAYMVPTQFSRLLALPEEVRGRYDVSSLHAVVHSAAPCPRDVKQKMMDWWGPVVWETYGGMEGAATIAKPHRWLEKPGTVGRSVRGVTLAILDDDGNELPPGEIGNIYMENEVGFSYHGDEEGTKQAHKGKRFSLGDLGYLDEDGYLFISGRAKDMIITGGTNVYPAEIEAVLLGHPAVADVGVIGIPDPDWGESVKAVVQPAAGVEPSEALAAELIAYCRERLASYKCPRSVDFRATLPRTEAGKLYKRQLADEYAAASRG